MARNKFNVITQREESLTNRADEVGVIAAWEIGAPNRPCKQDITHKGNAVGQVKEYDMARRVAGTVNHFEDLLPHRDGVAVFQPAIGGEGLEWGEAKHLPLDWQLRDPELVVAVGPLDGNAQALGENRCLATMVNVAMGEEDLLDLHTRLLGHGLEVVDITTGVNEGRPASGGADNQRTILGKRRNRVNLVIHVEIIAHIECQPEMTGVEDASLGDLEGVVLEVGQGEDLKGLFVSGLEHHWRGHACIGRLSPTACTDAPTVAGLESGEAKLRPRCAQIVSAMGRENQEGIGHDGTDCVTTKVFFAGVAAAVSEKASQRIKPAGLQFRAENIFGLNNGLHARKFKPGSPLHCWGLLNTSPADMTDIRSLRSDYALASLDTPDLAQDPTDQLQKWLNEAIQSEVPEPNAMTLCTVAPDGRPTGRIVLLRNVSKQGLSFFTNYDSAKGQALMAQPYASLVFFWPDLERQIRIDGKVGRLSAEESERYYAERPLGSKLGAWASPQSQVIESRQWLESAHESMKATLGEHPPRPANWGGYQLVPERFEFWQGRRSRLHDRLQYRFSQLAQTWEVVRLAP